jgi:2-haloacid dehalogenase
MRWASFDCYGTLVDWERGIRTTFERLWPDADGETLLARYHQIERDVQADSSASYREVLSEVLRRLCESQRLQLSIADKDALSATLPDWPPFPEVPDALRKARAAGWQLAILSNTDPDLLDASVSHLGVDIDLRVTAAEAKSYKPAPGHWERFFELSGADPARHVHVAASLFHDIEPASRLGLQAVWINRKDERSDLPRAAELADLRGLASALDAAVPP